MATTRNEGLPATWSDARDVPFFRITARLFSADFCLGASVLLAANDGDVETTAQTPWTPSGVTGTRELVTRTDAELIPVRVRRAPND